MILTNPPFGGEEEAGIQGNFPDDKQTAETALLFLQLIMRKLRRQPKPGRAARGRAQRHALRRRCLRPHQGGTAEGVQPPYHRAAAQRRVCALHRHPDQPAVLRPLRPDARGLVLRAAACPRAARITPRRSPSSSRSSRRCLDWWQKRAENDRAWKVPADELLANDCNLDRKNPNGRQDFEHLPPEQLAEDILKKEQRIMEIMAEIMAVLKEKP